MSVNDIIIIIVLFWALGGFAWAAEKYRRVRAAREEAAEVRHRRQVELSAVQAGMLTYIQDGPSGRPRMAVPAAVIPAPPGAAPVSAVPGSCRHERIVPVITGDGEVVKWICANHPRCSAEFPPDTAIYAGEA